MQRKPAKTYDEIVRRTVPSPDLTFRAAEADERASLVGPRALTRNERALVSRVRSALHAELGDESDKITIDLVPGKLALQGEVASMDVLRRAEAIASALDDADEIDNQLVVRR
jgi:osmotically-inducible protein OsmY